MGIDRVWVEIGGEFMLVCIPGSLPLNVTTRWYGTLFIVSIVRSVLTTLSSSPNTLALSHTFFLTCAPPSSFTLSFTHHSPASSCHPFHGSVIKLTAWNPILTKNIFSKCDVSEH
ncbi:hypothetical protein L1987_33822 [Smallanthus sonchifolius]|uniref:Uncharacterized protein n=1 Tax=Smallanthus sonchifolius TaxID=185202 RepID=A0ACB9HTU1_9ASTR|nr:hypothetical protein L1987_33822 [Smallanthus sonchifolius]